MSEDARRRQATADWVPLFLSPKQSSNGSPLQTTASLPQLRRSSRVSESTTNSTPASPSTAQSQHLRPPSPPLPFLPGLNSEQPTLRTDASTSSCDTAAAQSVPLARRRSKQAGEEQTSHLRRRSSVQVAASSRQATAMARQESLTTFMNGKPRQTYKSSPRLSDLPAKPRARRYRCRGTLLTLAMVYVAIRLLRAFIRIVAPTIEFEAAIAPIASLLPHRILNSSAVDANGWLDHVLPVLYDSLPLETVPYALDTHPPTPSTSEAWRLSLADYITTRFGSHFGIPTRDNEEASHLWLAAATGESCKYSIRHLQAFVRSLDRSLVRLQVDAQGASSPPSHPQDPKRGDSRWTSLRRIERKLVTLCADIECVETCRKQGWYCYPGFVNDAKAYPRLKRAELVKLRAATELLATGRRIFVVDGEAYFKEDPLVHLEPLDHYDLQIPPSWSSSNTRTGFAFFNPTQNVISLLKKTLEIIRAPENAKWRHSNLLLDPSGTLSFDGESGAAAARSGVSSGDVGYGQTTFVSPWGEHGGMDVHVLSKHKFRPHSGRLDQYTFEKRSTEQSAYFFCPTCDNLRVADLVASSLGFHQPAVVLASLENMNKALTFLSSDPILGGPDEHRFAASIVMQIAKDSQRAVLPPIEGTIDGRKRYIWRIFPITHWVHGTKFDDRQRLPVRVVEPMYVEHVTNALKLLRSQDEHARQVVAELEQEPLWLDLAQYDTYADMLRALKTSYFSQTRVVKVEDPLSVRGKKGWALRDEFKSAVELCHQGQDDDMQEELCRKP